MRRDRARRSLWWVVALVLLAASGASAIEFEASVDRLRVGRSDPIRLVLTVRSEGNLNHVPAPDISLSDFDVHGPSVSTQVSMVNFSTTYVRELTYTLFARRTGRITIGPARLTVGGEQYETNAIEVEVVDGQAGQAGAAGRQRDAQSSIGENLYVRVNQSHARVYVGQQLTIEYDLCYRYRLYDVSFKEIPDFSGFWSRELFVAQQLQPRRENIGGVAFNVAPLRRMALFPTSAGSVVVEPMTVTCQIPRGGGRRRSLFDDFGLRGSLQPAQALSEPVTIEVMPLPAEGRPASFGGAVGQFALEATARPLALQVGDPVTFTVKVTGQGNKETMPPPNLSGLEGFAVYDPKVTDEEAVVGGWASFTRTFEYILIPERGGRLEIPPVEIAYFDPDAAQYRTLLSPAYGIEAEGEAVPAAGGGLMRQQIQAVGRDIRYIKPDLKRLTTPMVLHRHWAFWTLQLLLPVAFGGLWGWQRHRRRLQGDVAYARRRRAGAEAKGRLKQAEALRLEGDAVAFYAEVQRALLRFLGDRLNLPAAGLGAERSAELLSERGVEEATVEAWRRLLERCDYARFAPGAAAEDLAEALQEAEGILGALEKKI